MEKSETMQAVYSTMTCSTRRVSYRGGYPGIHHHPPTPAPKIPKD